MSADQGARDCCAWPASRWPSAAGSSGPRCSCISSRETVDLPWASTSPPTCGPGDDLVAGAPVYIGADRPAWRLQLRAAVGRAVRRALLGAGHGHADRHDEPSACWPSATWPARGSGSASSSGTRSAPCCSTPANIEFLIAAAIVLAARGHCRTACLHRAGRRSPRSSRVPRSGWREAALVIGVAFSSRCRGCTCGPSGSSTCCASPRRSTSTSGRPGTCACPSPCCFSLCGAHGPPHWRSMVAMPSLWLGTLVILIAAIRLWLDDRSGKDRCHAGNCRATERRHPTREDGGSPASIS